ncbi:MAG: ribonuclease PH [Deltaproteobacteria bacterium]|nr:ribonuclease PH [Deltaproteobacteria bacterium]
MPRRPHDELRPLAITPHYLLHPEGSALIEWGDTKVICTASIDDKVPPWLNGKGRGWLTAEYDMLPRATTTRNQRDSQRAKPNGRSQEISRLIGRALRAVVDTTGFGERTITIDCDVIQADGGTRTASITGGYVALGLAVRHLIDQEQARKSTLKDHVAAVSLGIVEGQSYLDLDYSLDSRAQVDMNVVMTGSGRLIEVQGTAEQAPFSRDELGALLDLAFAALPRLIAVQKRAIDTPRGPAPIVVRA